MIRKKCSKCFIGFWFFKKNFWNDANYCFNCYADVKYLKLKNEAKRQFPNIKVIKEQQEKLLISNNFLPIFNYKMVFSIIYKFIALIEEKEIIIESYFKKIIAKKEYFMETYIKILKGCQLGYFSVLLDLEKDFQDLDSEKKTSTNYKDELNSLKKIKKNLFSSYIVILLYLINQLLNAYDKNYKRYKFLGLFEIKILTLKKKFYQLQKYKKIKLLSKSFEIKWSLIIITASSVVVAFCTLLTLFLTIFKII